MGDVISMDLHIRNDGVTVNNLLHSGFDPHTIPMAVPFTLDAGQHHLQFTVSMKPDGSRVAALVIDAESTEIRGELPPAS